MKDEKFITIATHTYSRSILLQGMLEVAGISSFLRSIDEPGGGVEVKIREKDTSAAYKVLSEFSLVYGKAKETSIKTLKSIRRILVPVDFSPMSIQAAHYALELAKTLKADIRLLHVWFSNAGEPFVLNEVYAYQVNFEGILKEQEDEARNRIDAVCQEMKKMAKDKKIKGVHIDFDLVRGNAIEAILRIADDYQPGLVVMGTRGKNRESRNPLGSTTARIIEKCRFPVLTIPVDYEVNDFIQPRNVLYITNFEESDFMALHKLIAFVRPFKVKIYCVHVNLNDSFVLDEVRMKKMREHFDHEYHEYNIECGLIESTDFIEGIENFIYEKEIDVISLVSHKRNLLAQLLKPSLSRKILFQSEVPLLVFNV